MALAQPPLGAQGTLGHSGRHLGCSSSLFSPQVAPDGSPDAPPDASPDAPPDAPPMPRPMPHPGGEVASPYFAVRARGPTISSGTTAAANSSALIKPSSTTASTKVVLSAQAFFATLAAWS